MESIATAISSVLLSGLFFPRLATGAGLAMLIGRFLYARGYVAKGPSGRANGAGIYDIALVVAFGATMWGGATLAGLPGKVSGLLKL